MREVDLDRRWVSVFVLGGAVVMAAVVILALAEQVETGRQERDAKFDLLNRLSERVTKATLTTAKDAPALDLIADSETLAAASLDARIRQLAAAQELAVLETRSESGRDPNVASIARVTMHVLVRGRIAQIQGFLYALEGTPPLASLDDLEISIRTEEGQVPSDPRLETSLTASMVWRRP